LADKALLLGINNYKSVNKLRGCENDVQSMSQLLTQVFEFDPQNIRTLLNQKVTKTEVTKQLKWLFKDVGKDDRVVLHFSGHGSRIPDAEGEGTDDLICLYDMDFDNPDSYLRDKDLREWTKQLPEGAILTVILDNCNSGAGTRMIVLPGAPAGEFALLHIRSGTARAAAATSSRGLMQADHLEQATDANSRYAVAVRFVPPPPHLQQQMDQLPARRSLSHGLGEETMNHVLLAACGEEQTSADAFINNGYHGAFTYYLCDAATSSGATADRGDVMALVKQSLSAGSFEQDPQLEGPAALKKGPLFTIASDSDRSRPGPATSTATSPAAASPAETQRALLELINRLLDTFQAGQAKAPAALQRAVITRQLVYVHGICRHVAGYSNGWWQAMSPFVASLQPGDLDGNRHEVLWSDLINTRALAAPALAASPATQRELRDRLVARLADRIERQALATAPPSPPGAPARALVVPRALPSIPGLSCIDDFTVYLLNSSIRQQVIDRFVSVTKPLIQAGNSIEVISHSWGTVVAYEALRLMDADPQLPSGQVLNFFTVGSALSIFEVKQLLLPEASDGQRPRLVRRWTNLNAHGDVVGGPLKDNPYQVDDEFLNLEAVGCPAFLGIVNPSCAHGSYFNAANLAVNRDIFGAEIES
jgi:hypothetical protein